MNSQIQFCKSNILIALLVIAVAEQTVLGASAQAQGALGSMNLQPLNNALNYDSSKAAASQAQFDQYRAEVSGYMQTVQERCAEAHCERLAVETRCEQLKKQLPGLSGDEKSTKTKQIGNLQNWLNSESNMNQQAVRNIDLCQRWLAHCKDQANIDRFNAQEDEQNIQDEQHRIYQAQQLMASEQRKASDRAYWEAKNAQPYYSGGYGRRGGGFHGYPRVTVHVGHGGHR